MYKSVIKLKDGLSEDKVAEIKKVSEECFITKWGALKDISTDPNIILHESENVLAVVNADIELCELGFNDCFESWDFIDTNNARENYSTLTEHTNWLIYKQKQQNSTKGITYAR